MLQLVRQEQSQNLFEDEQLFGNNGLLADIHFEKEMACLGSMREELGMRSRKAKSGSVIFAITYNIADVYYAKIFW